MDELLKVFSPEIKKVLQKEDFSEVEEIRIRLNRNIILKKSHSEKVIDKKVSRDEIMRTLQNICENSIYSYQRKIAEGFITLKGGHRVGISGSTVIENEKVININYIFSLNFRIAREIIGASKYVKQYILNKNGIYNTIIFSSPGKGKTTILRDLVREFSKVKNIGVVDERSELCAMYMGNPQNDIGEKIDILENVKKSIGLKMLIRTMAPEIVVADEIGTDEDIEAINYAVSSGVSRNIYGAWK